ncbi:hypothetical protein EDD16DRAFT_162613 [Pisolithus croceorrhizus]|nr:hypothetical protein EDD16DRAFT_162613 [Pisolithus croceorrhizus]
MMGVCVHAEDVSDSYQPIIIGFTGSRVGRLRGGCALLWSFRFGATHATVTLNSSCPATSQTIVNKPALLSLVWYFWQRKWPWSASVFVWLGDRHKFCRRSVLRCPPLVASRQTALRVGNFVERGRVALASCKLNQLVARQAAVNLQYRYR